MKQITCLVCGGRVEIRPARGRKSNKPFLMLICAVDGRHFRGFVSDQNFVKSVIESSGGVAERNG